MEKILMIILIRLIPLVTDMAENKRGHEIVRENETIKRGKILRDGKLKGKELIDKKY